MAETDSQRPAERRIHHWLPTLTKTARARLAMALAFLAMACLAGALGAWSSRPDVAALLLLIGVIAAEVAVRLARSLL